MTVEHSLAGPGPDTLAGKVALVTGAGSGQGRAVTQLFITLGASVLAIDHDEVGLRGTLDHAAHPESLIVETLEISNPEQARAAVARAVSEFGSLTTLVVNAHSTAGGTVAEAEWDDVQQVLTANVSGMFAACRYAVPAMLHGGGGSVITMTLGGSNDGEPGSAVQCASTGAMERLARSVAVDYSDRGVRSNCIRVAGSDEESLGEAAQLAAFLASDESRLITGSTVTVDGGHSRL